LLGYRHYRFIDGFVWWDFIPSCVLDLFKCSVRHYRLY